MGELQTLKVKPITKKNLIKLKVHPRESFDEVINRYIKKESNKDTECPHASKSLNQLYIYTINKTDFMFCPKCHNLLYEKMRKQKEEEKHLPVFKRK